MISHEPVKKNVMAQKQSKTRKELKHIDITTHGKLAENVNGKNLVLQHDIGEGKVAMWRASFECE